MEIKKELLVRYISVAIEDALNMPGFDADEIADSTAIEVLAKIQEIIQDDELSDFDAIEEIVQVFEEYKLSSGGRHDF